MDTARTGGRHMQVDRRFLYAGVFLVAIGAVLVAADLGAVDAATLTGALQLWALALVAIGLGLVLRRTQLALALGIVAAAIPGVVLGGALAVAPGLAVDCGNGDLTATTATERGVFDAPANISVTTGCGSLTLGTAPGRGWELRAGNTEGRTPSVVSSPASLDIDAAGDDGWRFPGGHDTWDLALPTTPIERLSLTINAGSGEVDLPDAQIDRLALTANAGAVEVDASEASVADLSVVVRGGAASVRLPSNSDVHGSLRVAAGAIEVCAPPELGLRLTSNEGPGHVSVAGREHPGSGWQSPNYETATHRADLEINASFGAVEINPIGGCR